MRRFTRFASLLPLIALLSCASTSELVRRGEVALDSGDMDHAYDWARRALDRDPGNPRAREIMTAAAVSIVNERKTEITSLAGLDTLAAARAAIELAAFGAKLRTYGVKLPPDPEFREREAAIRTGAARVFYQRGVESLAANRPKRAHAELTEASRYAPGYPDLGVQLDRAWQEAVTHVAILPFNDEVSEPAFTDQLSDEVHHQMEYQLRSKRFQFTRLIGRDQVNRRLTVAQAGHLSREEAVRLGRAVGAKRVVFGRIHDLRSDTRTDTYREEIYRRVVELVGGRPHAEDGRPVTRFEPQQFEAVARRREVSVVLDLEVLETGTGGLLARNSLPRSIAAHTVFTRVSTPPLTSAEYCLVPPPESSTDWGKRREKDWRNLFGSWALPDMLDRARRDPDRTRYQERYRPEFSSAGTSTPVWLDDIPPVEELAYIALADAWMPMLDMLRNLDGKDDADLLPPR